MKINEKGIALIKGFEGFRDEAYKCPAGVWTIGYGHTEGVKKGDKITEKKASELLTQEVNEFSEGVKKLVKVELNDNQFSALVSFAYNVGLGNLKSSTLLKKINNGDIVGAANEFERWNKANGKVLNGLTNRRLAEKKLFLEV